MIPCMTSTELSPVHYLPIATTVVALAFLPVLLLRARLRGWPPHLVWWAIGVACYGSGTMIESIITLGGNSAELNRWWYLAGAILGAWPLATGSVYLVLARRTASILTAISAVPLVVAAVAVMLSPIDAAQLASHRPSGSAIEWTWIRAMTPLINVYAAFFLVGGAVWSCVRFRGVIGQRGRVMGTALIAMGGLLPGIGGAMAKTGMVEALYVAELAGLVLIWVGYECCTRSGDPVAIESIPSRSVIPPETIPDQAAS
ncbi:MAG: hypothetical protein CMJ34_00255 [Phycisphaerae bacterium]|nr:hypothetical protein [Phycisphaerae bacterium]